MKKLIVIGILFYSSQAFSRLPPQDFFYEERNFLHNENIHVVFFQQEGDYLISECQISVKKYPQILSNQLRHSLLKNSYVMRAVEENLGLEKNQEFLPINNTFNLLDECEPQFSLTLVDSAKHFELYPQVAAVPLVLVGTGAGLSKAAVFAATVTRVLSCALGGIMGYFGSYTSQVEDQRANILWKWFPTRGEFFTGAGVAAGGAIGAVQTNAYLPIVQKGIAKVALQRATIDSGITGAMCGVGGGVVGYFHGRSEKAGKAQ